MTTTTSSSSSAAAASSRRLTLALLVLLASTIVGCAHAWQPQRPSAYSLPKQSHTSHTGGSSSSSSSSRATSQLPVSYSASATATSSSPSWRATTSTTSIPWNLPTLNGRRSRRSTAAKDSASAYLQRKRFGRSKQAVKTSATSTSSTTTTTRQQEQQQRRFRVYCDLDGVLVDFESGIRKLFPHDSLKDNFNVDDLHRGTMWQRVAAAPSFFEHLPWTNQGRLLWNAIAPLKPDILTGVPAYERSRVQKFQWCQRELGVPVTHHDKVITKTNDIIDDNETTEGATVPGASSSWTRAREFLMQRQSTRSSGTTTTSMNAATSPVVDDDVDHFYDQDYSDNDNKQEYTRVITCWSRDKYLESGKDAVLIDDRLELKDDWEAAGGTFIHHNGNVHETIQKLRHAGILVEDEQQEQQNGYSYNNRGMMP